MYRANVVVGEGIDRKLSFEFPQTVSRDEVLQKVFNTNKSWKTQLKDPNEDGIFPGVFITWENLDSTDTVEVEEPEAEVSRAKDTPVDMGQSGIKGPTDASPSKLPEDADERVKETDAG